MFLALGFVPFGGGNGGKAEFLGMLQPHGAQSAGVAQRFFHLAMRRGRKIAKVAMARKLAVHLYWMWRQGRDYGPWQKLGSKISRAAGPN